MNIIQGLSISGLTLLTEKNFNSIPGLMQWCDARERVELQAGKVSLWGDKSSQNNNLVMTRVDRQPTRENGLWIRAAADGIYLMSNRRDYNFLHNGQKFGIYAIQKPTWTLATSANAYNLLYTGGAGSIGLQGTLGTNLGSGRSGYTLRGGATSPSKLITTLLDTNSPNYSPSGQIYSTSFVNFGQTTGVKVTHGNAVQSFTPFFSSIADYPQGNHQVFLAVAGANGITVRVGILLIYNWTGFTTAQVQGFDSEVMALLNAEKLIFQNLDI